MSTVVIDLFGDRCNNMEDGENLINMIEKGTKSYATCMDIGFDHWWHIIGHSLKDFSEKLCHKIAKDDKIKGEFNLIGSGPAGVMARYVVEECPMEDKKVRNLLTLGSPNMGMESLPFCYQGFVCGILNHFAHKLSMWKMIQEFFPLSELIYDSDHMEKYLKKSKLMPELNNMKKDTHSILRDEYKKDFTSLNKAMFVKYSDDNIMYPKESAWFQQVDATGKVVPLNESDYYTHDNFGLKTLVEEGKASFVTFEGQPPYFKESDVTGTIIPFLNQ